MPRDTVGMQLSDGAEFARAQAGILLWHRVTRERLRLQFGEYLLNPIAHQDDAPAPNAI